MNVKQLIEELKKFDECRVVVCMDEQGGWDNIQEVNKEGGIVSIVFGGGGPFSDEQEVDDGK